MNILSLDIGTRMGFAYNLVNDFQCGTWALATPKEITAFGQTRMNRRNDPRIKKLCEILTGLPEFDIVCFEDVLFSSFTLQTQLWAALRSAIWLCARTKHFECVPVTTLKKFAIHGAATKQNMRSALAKRHPKIFSNDFDDNAVDAAWIWIWGQENLSRMKL